MAKPGPAPKPRALKILAGNPGHQDLSRRELKAPPIAPPIPTWLDREAKAEWRRCAPHLERLGLLTQLDMAAFAAYCQSYARWRQAERILQAEGLTFETDSGYVQQHPAVAIANKYLSAIKTLCCEFGMTPSSRMRFTLPDEDDDDPFGILD